jgi:hypothetical protein
VTDGPAASNADRPAKALRAFTQAGSEWLDPRTFYGEVVLLDYGCPDGANIGVSTQNGDEVSLAIAVAFDLANEPIQVKPDARCGVLHPLRVFQNAEALVGILHDGCPLVIGEIRLSGREQEGP